MHETLITMYMNAKLGVLLSMQQFQVMNKKTNANDGARTHADFGETHLQSGGKTTAAPSYQGRIETPM